MTLENLNYRTNPMFLRNQFSSSNSYGIPDVPKVEFNDDEWKDLRLLAFNQSKSDNGLHNERIVHFFLYDYNFESIWKTPEKFVELLSKYKGVLTPDFSMYTEMPYAVQIYNTFRNRWCGAYLASKGIRVIPTVAWSDSGSFNFCFKGIKKGSVVAVSTYMFHESKNHAAQKELFMKGYNKMLEEIEPSAIICYSEPFPDMEGNIIYVDYDLSSWRHMEDDIVPKEVVKHTYGIFTRPPASDIIIKTGYVCKGGGSAFGGDWKPKNENSKRFLGEPNTVKENTVTTTKGSYKVKDYYDKNGKAVAERHYTDHNKPTHHTDPHDHTIDWSRNVPAMGDRRNYPNGEAPSFEEFIQELLSDFGDIILGDEKSMKNYKYNPDDYKFETLGEFKFYLSCGANVGFEYNGIEYGIEAMFDENTGKKIENCYNIWIYDERFLAEDITLEEVLDFKLDGVKIRDLILTAEITERIM